MSEIPYYHKAEFEEALWNINRCKKIEQIPEIEELYELFYHPSDLSWHSIQIALGEAICDKINRLNAGNIY